MNKTILRIGILLILAAVIGAPLPAFAQTLHGVIIADTLDSSIGVGVRADLTNMSNELSAIARHTGMRLSLQVFKDRQIIRANIASYIERLRPDPSDTVIVYYSGHGYRTGSQASKFPALALRGPRWDSQGLESAWIFNTIKSKNPRFLFVMADCCNNILPEGAIDTQRSIRSGIAKPESYRKLFLNFKGSIISSGSKPGEYAYGPASGGLYTTQFLSVLQGAVASANPDWNRIMNDATRPVYYGRQNPQFDIIGVTALELADSTEPEQKPDAEPDTTPLADKGPLGDFDVEGTNTDGSVYSGSLSVSKSGETYQFKWNISGEMYTGTGAWDGDQLVINFGSEHPVIYKLIDDGRLVGVWANGNASEICTPKTRGLKKREWKYKGKPGNRNPGLRPGLKR